MFTPPGLSAVATIRPADSTLSSARLAATVTVSVAVFPSSSSTITVISAPSSVPAGTVIESMSAPDAYSSSPINHV